MKFPDYIPDAARHRYHELSRLCLYLPQDRRDCLDRLITRPEMKSVFNALEEIASNEANSGSNIDLREVIGKRAWQFLDAAWCAHQDYKRARDQRQRTRELAEEISATAERLAILLRQATKGSDQPIAFSSVRELLEISENFDGGNHSQGLWRAFRSTLVDGDPMVRSAWEKAPPLHYLMSALAGVAQEFVPTGGSRTIAAALANRQANKKTEYLRAFAHLLVTSWGFQVSSDQLNLLKAMAETTTVVIDDPGQEIVATLGDVQKMLTSFDPAADY